MKALALLVLVLTVTPMSDAASPVALSKNGKALWGFEALLHDRFANRAVCSRSQSFDFVANGCSPLAIWTPYFYVFANAHGSPFHTTAVRPSGNFGNYPVLVRVAGKYVACDPKAKTFLIEFRDARNFSVGCQAPNR
jgi:hypothetical protein